VTSSGEASLDGGREGAFGKDPLTAPWPARPAIGASRSDMPRPPSHRLRPPAVATALAVSGGVWESAQQAQLALGGTCEQVRTSLAEAVGAGVAQWLDLPAGYVPAAEHEDARVLTDRGVRSTDCSRAGLAP